MSYEIKRYGARYWAVYQGLSLLAVTLYKKGALTLLNEFNRLLERVIK